MLTQEKEINSSNKENNIVFSVSFGCSLEGYFPQTFYKNVEDALKHIFKSEEENKLDDLKFKYENLIKCKAIIEKNNLASLNFIQQYLISKHHINSSLNRNELKIGFYNCLKQENNKIDVENILFDTKKERTFVDFANTIKKSNLKNKQLASNILKSLNNILSFVSDKKEITLAEYLVKSTNFSLKPQQAEELYCLTEDDIYEIETMIENNVFEKEALRHKQDNQYIATSLELLEKYLKDKSNNCLNEIKNNIITFIDELIVKNKEEQMLLTITNKDNKKLIEAIKYINRKSALTLDKQFNLDDLNQLNKSINKYLSIKNQNSYTVFNLRDFNNPDVEKDDYSTEDDYIIVAYLVK